MLYSVWQLVPVRGLLVSTESRIAAAEVLEDACAVRFGLPHGGIEAG